jgi:hypothetical protein
MEFNLIVSIINAGKLCLKLICLITLLMILYEFFENSKLFSFFEKLLEKPLAKIGFSANSSISMLVGIVLGIAYGAGILIKNATSGRMNFKETILTALFLATCHAVFEDTLIFVAIGGNGIIILGTRILVAILIIGLLSKYIKFN